MSTTIKYPDHEYTIEISQDDPEYTDGEDFYHVSVYSREPQLHNQTGWMFHQKFEATNEGEEAAFSFARGIRMGLVLGGSSDVRIIRICNDDIYDWSHD